MGIIKPSSETVKNFKGLHLYHAGMSNCAMRVRLTLAEKNLDWTSHLLNLMKGEQLSEQYFAINPNGVVPTLIDEGVTIIDSADIIDYLDRNYSPNTLRPNSKLDEQKMYEWMYLARDNHLSIKTYMYGNLGKINDHMKRSKQQMEQYRINQTYDVALLAFHERFNSNEGFSDEELRQATLVIDDCFQAMDDRLKTNQWLAGDTFSLADIAWIPQLVVLKAANYPFEKYKYFEKWKNTIVQRPSFKKAVLDWLPERKG